MTCPAQVFTSVTPEHFARIVEKAAAVGLIIRGNIGTMSHMSFDLTWHFEPATGVFTVQCTQRPFIVSCATINERINELVDLCQGQVAVTAAEARDTTTPT